MLGILAIHQLQKFEAERGNLLATGIGRGERQASFRSHAVIGVATIALRAVQYRIDLLGEVRFIAGEQR